MRAQMLKTAVEPRSAKEAEPLLLQGLRPMMDRRESLAWFKYAPALPQSLMSLDVKQRLLLLPQLKEIHCPRKEYADLYIVAESAMRHSYGRRNPQEFTGKAHLYVRNDAVELDLDNPAIPTAAAPDYDGSNILVLGGTGCGKSRWALRMAKCHPACIDLRELSGGKVPYLQVPVLYVRCPSESTVQGMVSGFLDALEAATQEVRLLRAFRRAKYSTTDAARIFAQLCKTFFVGLIIWDEFQDLVEANQRGTRLMNNFLMYVRDVAGVPMVYVGNYSMWEAFEGDARVMRRSQTGGTEWIDRFEDRNDVGWKAMVEMYWRFQVVKKPAPMTESIRQVVYSLTQGVPDYLRNLMEAAQRLALTTGCERVDENLLVVAYENCCGALHGPIEALKSGSPRELKRYKGLLSPRLVMAARLQEAKGGRAE